MQALLFSAPIAAMLASTIRMSRASMMSRERDVAGVVEEAPQRRDAGEPADLVARGVEALGGARCRRAARSCGSSVRKNSAVWSRSGVSAQAS